MRCSNCNAEIPENNSCCPKCGQKQTGNTNLRLCCPRCGSRNLSGLCGTNIGGAATSGIVGTAIGGLGMGALFAAGNMQQKVSFVCLDCGKKFRSPDELRQEITSRRQNQKFVNIIMTPLQIIVILLLIGMAFEGAFTVGLIFCVPSFAFCSFFKYLGKKLAEEPQNELKEIEDGLKKYMQ